MKFLRLLRCVAMLILMWARSSLAVDNFNYTAHDLGSGVPHDINSSGTVVGQMFPAGSPYAFSYSGGVLQNLGTFPDHTDSGAAAINNSGVIVGSSSNPNGPPFRGFSYSGGVMS